jgi:hypothetical protein
VYTATVTVANSGNGISESCTVSFTVTRPELYYTDSSFVTIYGTAAGPAVAIEMNVYYLPANPVTNPVYKLYYKAGDHPVPGNFSGWTAVSGGAATVVPPYNTTGVVTIPAGDLTEGQNYTGVVVLTSDSHQDSIISSRIQKFTYGTATAVLDLSSASPGGNTITPYWYYSNNIYYIGADVTVTGTCENNRRLVVPAGVQDITVTLNNVTIAGITETWTYPTPLTLGAGAKITLNLVGTSALTGKGGRGTGFAAIEVPETAELSITGDGQLTAAAGLEGGGPGIGGRLNRSDCGTVIINSGTVIAQGRFDYGGNGCGAGIGGAGGSERGKGGRVTINGGQVTAIGGINPNNGTGAAGIGGGGGTSYLYGAGGTVTINGGQVTARGARAFGGSSGSPPNHGTVTAVSGYSWQYSANSNGDEPQNGLANGYSFSTDHKWVQIEY